MGIGLLAGLVATLVIGIIIGWVSKGSSSFQQELQAWNKGVCASNKVQWRRVIIVPNVGRVYTAPATSTTSYTILITHSEVDIEYVKPLEEKASDN